MHLGVKETASFRAEKESVYPLEGRVNALRLVGRESVFLRATASACYRAGETADGLLERLVCVCFLERESGVVLGMESDDGLQERENVCIPACGAMGNGIGYGFERENGDVEEGHAEQTEVSI